MEVKDTCRTVQEQRGASLISGSPVLEGQDTTSVVPILNGDTNLGGSSSLCQAPNQTQSSPQVREVRRKRRVVLQRCRGLGLYMVRGNATVLILRGTHTRCQFMWTERSGSAASRAVAYLVKS